MCKSVPGKGIVMPESDAALAGFVRETAEGFGVAGAAAGVWADGREVFAGALACPMCFRPPY
jgi:hypothetical protein